MPNWFIHGIANLALWYVLKCTGLVSAEKSIIVLVLLLSSNLIDIDHLIKRPIYDKHRSSINFHALHKYWQMPFYFAGMFLPAPYRFFFIGVCMHLFLDYLEHTSYWKTVVG